MTGYAIVFPNMAKIATAKEWAKYRYARSNGCDPVYRADLREAVLLADKLITAGAVKLEPGRLWDLLERNGYPFPR